VTLHEGSPSIGVPVRDGCFGADRDDLELVLVIRGHELLPSGSRSPLRAGDRLLLIVSSEARGRLDALGLAPEDDSTVG